MRTKTILPRRQKDLLSRYRLLSMLDDLLDYRLTLITAPAGYGKTSLLVDLAHKVEYPVCWLAIDPLDNDPIRFISYFVAAINQQFPDFGGPSRSLISNLGGNDLDLEQILRTIINDLYDHVREHFALVLDDFHLIDSNPEINYFINHIIQEMDDNCHIVIASRSLLSLPDMPLMVGRSQVKGLSFEELAFIADEIKELYQIKYQQVISVIDTERIINESEGWITGLLLTAETAQLGLTDQGRAARAAGIDVYDYLARQVLDQQTPEMQVFLLKTSLLEEFNEELCQQTLGDSAGDYSWGDLIRELLQKNLFIQPVESSGTWLRYHHLFRDFLRQQCKEHYPDQTKDLLLKMVEVYRDHEWFEYAYTTCRLIGDDQLTADYIESVSAELVHRGQLSILKSWLDDLSPALIEMNPGLLGNLGALTSMTGNPESGLQMLNRAMEGLSKVEDPAIFSLLSIRRATCQRYLGNCQSGLDDALLGLELAKKDEDGIQLVAKAESEIGLNKKGLGLVQEAEEHLQRSLDLYLEQNDQRNAAYVQIDLGLVEMNQGNYAAAKSQYQQAYNIWEDLENLGQLVGLSNNLGVLDHLTGDYLQAFDWFTQGLESARQASILTGTAYILASLADLALDLGAFPRAEDYINESLIIAEEIGDTYIQVYLHAYLQLSMAGTARGRGDMKTAREQLDAVEYSIRDHPDGSVKGRYHLETGFTFMEENLLDQAYTEFEAALEFFESNKLSIETCQSLAHLARIDCLRGESSKADHRLKSVQKIIQSVGTIQPLVPSFARQDDLLTCLEDHLPDDPFTIDLVRAVSAFRSRLPILLEKLAFNIVPADSAQQPLLDINSLGKVSVKFRGELLSVPEWAKQKTVRELFFYLISSEEGLSREEICLDFWPDSEPEQLKKQFKNALYRLRRAVGKETILYDPLSRLYYFNRDLDYQYDVEQFFKNLKEAEIAVDPESRIRMLKAAADLYQGPFAPSLEGIWTEPIRYGLYLDYENTMLTLAEEHLSSGNPASSLEVVEELLQISPSQEKAWRLALRSYAEKGDRSGIERTFQRCLSALEQDLNAEPSPETLSLYQDLMS